MSLTNKWFCVYNVFLFVFSLNLFKPKWPLFFMWLIKNISRSMKSNIIAFCSCLILLLLYKPPTHCSLQKWAQQFFVSFSFFFFYKARFERTAHTHALCRSPVFRTGTCQNNTCRNSISSCLVTFLLSYGLEVSVAQTHTAGPLKM